MTFCVQSAAAASSTQGRTYRDLPRSFSADTVAVDNLGPFRMRRTVYLDVERFEDGVVLSNDDLRLYAGGTDIPAAMRDLEVELRNVWRGYALCDDEKLDAVARGYKARLLDAIEGPMP